jgi:gamma-glutamylputrescine oxidase
MNPTKLSYWEREQYFTGIDVFIAGSGIVGINAALQLRKLYPTMKIVIGERGPISTGASTKNAGFACFGSMTELIDDLTRMSEDEVFALVERRFRGLSRLRNIVGDAKMDMQMLGGYEVFEDSESFKECADRIGEFNDKMTKTIGVSNVYSVADDKISSFGLGNVKHMILNSGEGQINSGAMMSTLISLAKQEGIQFMNGIEIESYSRNGNELEILTKAGFGFRTASLIICTNGFAKTLLPELNVEPARAQVLITKEIPGLKLRGTFHYDKGYYYFRNVGNRVLFGGGRNLNFKGENTFSHDLTEQIQQRLDELLKTMILPGTGYEVDMRWAGTMGVGEVKSPIVKEIERGVYCAVRMGGMGVALGSLVGEEVAALVR